MKMKNRDKTKYKIDEQIQKLIRVYYLSYFSNLSYDVMLINEKELRDISIALESLVNEESN